MCVSKTIIYQYWFLRPILGLTKLKLMLVLNYRFNFQLKQFNGDQINTDTFYFKIYLI